MILEKGNMWDVFHNTDVFMITTNPVIRKDGAVVMGRGIALEAKIRYPELPYDFGEKLKLLSSGMNHKNVGFIGRYEYTPIYWFMVKNHWKDNADLGIIKDSVFELQHNFDFEGRRIDLNFPGIGNGRLDRDSVLYLLEDLPDNIHIWEYK